MRRARRQQFQGTRNYQTEGYVIGAGESVDMPTLSNSHFSAVSIDQCPTCTDSKTNRDPCQKQIFLDLVIGQTYHLSNSSALQNSFSQLLCSCVCDRFGESKCSEFQLCACPPKIQTVSIWTNQIESKATNTQHIIAKPKATHNNLFFDNCVNWFFSHFYWFWLNGTC